MAHLTGSIAYPQQTSEVKSYSSVIPAKIALGTRARDKAGNEYVYVDFGEARAVGEVVVYDPSTFLTSVVTDTSVGQLGVVCGEASSSDMAGWLQIYGYNATVLASTTLTSGWLKATSSTDGYSVVANASASSGDLYKIAGMSAMTSASSATSPGYASTASSILGVFAARLNYPYIMSDISSS